MADDPFAADRSAGAALLESEEDRVLDAVLMSMRLWLAACRALILGEQLPDEVTALLADGAPNPDVDAAQAAANVWARALQNHVGPAIAETFGVGFAATARVADISPVHYQDAHMAEVFDRLKIWPDGAFEELRPELQEAVASSESIEQVNDRVGRVLDIDAPTRALRGDIDVIDKRLADVDNPLSKFEAAALRKERSDLWNQHDERLKEWRWKARRIARTEVQGAVEGGALASARATADALGVRMYKKWLATSDERTRRSHSIADGQIVPVEEKFRVGRSDLEHPADPRGLDSEIINCRCTLLILDEDEVSEAIRGKWGGRGVAPMSARLGPDSPELVDRALGLLDMERKGAVADWGVAEKVADRVVPAAVQVAETAAPAATAPGAAAAPPATGAKTEFAGRSIDDLTGDMNKAAEDGDFDRFDRIAAEVDKREAKNRRDAAVRAARREQKEARQMSIYERAIEDGLDDEMAIEKAFGITVERQRVKAAIAHLRSLGCQGRNFDELARDHWKDRVASQMAGAESSTDVQGYFWKRKYTESMSGQEASLWSMSDKRFVQYAGDELRGYLDSLGGRVTVEQIKAELVDPTALRAIQAGRRDYLT